MTKKSPSEKEKSETVRARVADEATMVAMPVIMPTRADTEDGGEPPPVPLRQVLIPVDGTPQGEFMVDWALKNFCREGDQINVLHVIPKRYAAYPTYGFEEYVPDLPDPAFSRLRFDSLPFLAPDAFTPEQEAAWRADAERYIAEKIAPALEVAGCHYTVEIFPYETDNSSVGEIICERAVDEDVAAVIMASHSKSRVREFFIGSVANYCLHRCKKPVIVFRAPPTLNEAAGKERAEARAA